MNLPTYQKKGYHMWMPPFMTFFSHCLEAERFFNPVYICISFNISAPVVEVTDCSANGDRDCENNAVNTQCIAGTCSGK